MVGMAVDVCKEQHTRIMFTYSMIDFLSNVHVTQQCFVYIRPNCKYIVLHLCLLFCNYIIIINQTMPLFRLVSDKTIYWTIYLRFMKLKLPKRG